MNLNINEAKLLFQSLRPVLTEDEDASLKTSVRFSGRQMAFLKSMQDAMPGRASLQDAVSILLDIAIADSCDRGLYAECVELSYLSILRQHNLHEIHINPLLALLGFEEVGLRALSNEYRFSDSLNADAKTALMDLFGIAQTYRIGQRPQPYTVPNIHHPKQALSLKESAFDALQPKSTLLLVSCPAQEKGLTMAVHQVEYALNPTKTFFVFYPVGRFYEYDDDGKNILKALSQQATDLGFRSFRIHVYEDYFDNILSGQFFTEPGAVLPGRYSSIAA